MNSLILLENMSYKFLLWLHFGTETVLQFAVFLIVIPILINVIIILMPKFSFGFVRTTTKVKTSDVKIDARQIPDHYKLAYAYSRNPALFPDIDKQDMSKIIRNLDEKIHGMRDESFSTTSKSDKNEILETKNEPLDGKFKLLGKGLNYLNLVVVTILLLLNIFGYYKYSNIFDTYFNQTNKGYFINIQQFQTAEEPIKDRLIRVNRYVGLINEVKNAKNESTKTESSGMER